jgi:hypothetical protein
MGDRVRAGLPFYQFGNGLDRVRFPHKPGGPQPLCFLNPLGFGKPADDQGFLVRMHFHNGAIGVQPVHSPGHDHVKNQ